MFRVCALLFFALCLSACATTPGDEPAPVTSRTPDRTLPFPGDIVDVPVAGIGAAMGPIAPEPDLDRPDPFDGLSGWANADLQPALHAFRRSCAVFAKRADARALIKAKPAYGTYADWASVCDAADHATHARPFFESLFTPASLSAETGLLTGYYEPEVEVRTEPDSVHSEPILTLPGNPATRKLPRARLNARSAPVIAYGRPIEVFFLHIQGSGRLHFPDGRTTRVGYAGNNGKPYTSIGRVLIERGELTRDNSGKRNIEAWMDAAGPDATRALMNENRRYIFFAERDIEAGEGPIGAMQVPLTAMGSVAVDPAHKPYGVPVWLDTRLPRHARDYKGAVTSLLVVTQDTGSAIKGDLRGDLFFGAGSDAGAKAGVMKHRVRWTVLLPHGLATRLQEPQA
ncbi:MltA domain-containing protein [uncultured Algimonas sp.]|uniref:murein transglycosylase A n=1 Tax=uncultured Algimonas sp. TaxID=1547920 RepID=UPI0026068DAF|nr:MltA domain-containing protein [uncultured Algimonas sp.]